MICSRGIASITKTFLMYSRSKYGRKSVQSFLDSLYRVQVLRSCSTSSGVSLHELKSRGLCELRGKDTVEFLQGLVTSDVTQLEREVVVQYSMMLNVQGRVLYDLLLYRHPNTSADSTDLIVECDGSIMEEMMKAIRRYKIRKKVDIIPITDEWRVFALVCKGEQKDVKLDNSVPDPRVPSFGWRILHSGSEADLHLKEVTVEDELEYHRKRYEWGIPEGVRDLPPGNCFPLESNLIFHNGVSFQKGCYIGQELTARTHHTGVTRKRLMPLVFDSIVEGSIKSGTNIVREDGRNVGKFRNRVGRYGLGLLRIGDLKGQLCVADENGVNVPLSAHKPSWWPQDN